MRSVTNLATFTTGAIVGTAVDFNNDHVMVHSRRSDME